MIKIGDKLGRFSVDSKEDMDLLAAIKAKVKSINEKYASEGLTDKYGNPLRVRVCLRGRRPKVKMLPKSHWIFGAPKNPVSYDYFGNIVGGIKNATIVDAYLYKRDCVIPYQTVIIE